MNGNGPMTGKVFGGRYEIGERVGLGGMAEVYSAQDSVLGRIVAVKVMLPQYADDPDFARRFRQEAAAAANLQSPYIVNVYDWGHDDDTYYIVMEYIRGSDLKTAIAQRGAINQRKVAEIGAQVCQALTVAHKQDIIHRDIKPQNIMVQPDGNVKVMDFGIARAKNSMASKTETVLGTAHYTSPEQAQGKDLTAASDIYSLGVVLYEAATGTLPFDGPDAVSVALMQVRDVPPAPREINPDIDPNFEAIILRAMEKDPAKRFATANDMRLALNNYLAGRPMSDVDDGATHKNGFTSAQTAIIAPIGAAAGGNPNETQVMPVTPGAISRSGGGRPSSRGTTSPTQRTYHGANDDEAASKKRRNVIIAIACIVAVVIVAAAIFVFGNPPEAEVAPVPNVVGKTIDEATADIEGAGFEVGRTQSEYDDSVEPGSIISQDPAGGEEAEVGTKINLVISQGTEEVDVPNVAGRSQAEAERLLTRAGFTVATTTEKSDDIDEGKVIRQTPEGGASAPKGSEVTIVLSDGSDTAEVPDIKGYSVDAARRMVENAGFKLEENGTDFSSSVPKDCIISQTPDPDSRLAKGSSVKCVVSKGPEDTSVSVPNVDGYTESGATSALVDAGFTVSVVTTFDPSQPEGTVVSQNPTPGTKAKKGSTVVITIATTDSDLVTQDE